MRNLPPDGVKLLVRSLRLQLSAGLIAYLSFEALFSRGQAQPFQGYQKLPVFRPSHAFPQLFVNLILCREYN